METEIQSFVKVWISAIASLTYCYFIPFNLPKGKLRLLSLLPVIFFFTLLPLNLTTISLGGSTAFFLTWLANFKLLLFSFGHGPLSSDPSISLPCFISVASLPIKLTDSSTQEKEEDHPSPDPKTQKKKPTKTKNKQNPSPQIPQNKLSPLNLTVKAIVLALLSVVYEHKQRIHPKLMLASYCCYVYISLELILAMVAVMAGALLGLELEPQFNEPYLSTSLQDFWGRRWNLMVTNIMRPTIYDPVKWASRRAIGTEWAPLPAVLVTFLASGLMHELIFFYLGRLRPTWEVTCFFLIHGLCVAMEIEVKKACRRRWRWKLQRVVSRVLAVGFVMVTAFWLFFPQLLRCDADVRAGEEVVALVGFAKSLGRSLDPLVGLRSWASAR